MKQTRNIHNTEVGVIRPGQFDLKHMIREPLLEVIDILSARFRQPHTLRRVAEQCSELFDPKITIVGGVSKAGEVGTLCLVTLSFGAWDDGDFDAGLLGGRPAQDDLRCEARA